MYRAMYFVATGWGLGRYESKANSYNELKEIVEHSKKHFTKKGCVVEKIVYTYPSGKQFTEKVARA